MSSFLILAVALMLLPLLRAGRSSSGVSRTYTLTPSKPTADGECMGSFVHWDGGLTRCEYPLMRCPNCWNLTPEQEAERRARQEQEDAEYNRRVHIARNIAERERTRRLKREAEQHNPAASSTGAQAGLIWDPARSSRNKPAAQRPDRKMTPNQRAQQNRKGWR